MMEEEFECVKCGYIGRDENHKCVPKPNALGKLRSEKDQLFVDVLHDRKSVNDIPSDLLNEFIDMCEKNEPLLILDTSDKRIQKLYLLPYKLSKRRLDGIN